MRTTPRMILILKRASSTVRWHKTLAQKVATTWWQEWDKTFAIAATWWQEFREREHVSPRHDNEILKKSHTAPLVHLQGSRRKTALPVNRNSAVKTLQRRSKHTNFCWTFSSWQITTILRTSKKTSTEFPNCQSHKPQRCPRLTGNLRNLNCLKTFSKRASKFTINWPKMTESITSILSWGEMRYKFLKTLMAQPERTWEKF